MALQGGYVVIARAVLGFGQRQPREQRRDSGAEALAQRLSLKDRVRNAAYLSEGDKVNVLLTVTMR